MMQVRLGAISFEILREGQRGNKKYVWGGVRCKNKICEEGGGVQKYKYVRGVGEKDKICGEGSAKEIKICGEGLAKFSPQDFKWNSPRQFYYFVSQKDHGH